MLQKLKNLFSLIPPPELQQRLEEMSRETPVPVFWLFGKTQSGKSSVIRFLTGAQKAEIGQGFKPCTRFSQKFDFPNEQTPLIEFLDTRGLDEPGYDPAEDIDQFNDQAHVLIVTVRVLDQALANIQKHLEKIRAARPSRPCLLLLTTLHEAYPQQQHPEHYPFQLARHGDNIVLPPDKASLVPDELQRALERQLTRFAGLYDYALPIDFTLPEEGYTEPNYGGVLLKEVLIEALPNAYRQTLIHLEETTGELRDLYARQALPYLIRFSGLAAAAGAVPVPWVDHFLVPAIQTRMITQLANLYTQPLQARQFMEMAGALGMGIAVRGALVKLVPWLGKAGNALAWGAATFALGKACCYYFSSIRAGHIPQAEELKQYYQDSVRSAEASWRKAQPQPV